MIATHREGATLLIELTRPDKGNALSAPLVEALIESIGTAFDDHAIEQVALCGRGRNFCTGLDLSDLDTVSDGDMLLRLVRIEMLLSMLWQAPIATACLAHGRAWGAGADLFVSCENRAALPGASWRFPGVQFGILLGTRRLAERVGSDAARSILTRAQQLDTERAGALGLVQEVLEPTQGGQDTPASLARTWIAGQPATMIDAQLARGLRFATRADRSGEDLATLVRSAATPGLKARIAAYRAKSTMPARRG